LKELRTGLKGMVNKNSLPVDQMRVESLRKAVTKIRDNSVQALKRDLPEGAHGEVDGLLNEILLADTAHASNINDLNKIKSVVGNKPINSASDFVSKLSDMKEADLAQRVSNLDVTSLRNLKSGYPKVFDQAKKAKINEMVGSSTNIKGFNESGFIKKYDALDSEMKALLFEPEMQSHIENLKKLKQAIPEMLGKSGTPEGIMTMEMFSPRRNALDFGIGKALDQSSKAASGVKEVAKAEPFVPATKTAVTNTVLNFKRPESNVLPFQAPKAADAKPKGEEKWANDGAKKLIDSGIDQKLIEQLKQDPKGKKLLIEASDLTPGSKGMEGVMKRIRTAYLNKGDQ